jgi:hypothetical protein
MPILIVPRMFHRRLSVNIIKYLTVDKRRIFSIEGFVSSFFLFIYSFLKLVLQRRYFF